MNLVVPLADVTPECRASVGGKATALARLRQSGFLVPDALCVTADAYTRYIDATGLRERVLMTVNRKR